MKAGNFFTEKVKILTETTSSIRTRTDNTTERTSNTIPEIKINPMQEYTDSGKNYISMIMKWKIHFIVITVAAIVVAAVCSSPLFIKPKYKSFAIVYPSNLKPYSTESETEQMLQLFRSADVRNDVIRKFH